MRQVTLLALLAVLGVSCGGREQEGESTPITVTIEAVDQPAFHPDVVTVPLGEPVRFVVTNTGASSHEFVVADEEMQMALAGTEEHGAHAAEALASLPLDPGQTEEVTLTFDEPGELQFACHVDGHYEAGMMGTITVG